MQIRKEWHQRYGAWRRIDLHEAPPESPKEVKARCKSEVQGPPVRMSLE
jgi:hypothetical protein